ncbi:MAG: DegT/DnrJ/EryC1/StrS family aminotransferase [candidate division WOR-3 bacterium]
MKVPFFDLKRQLKLIGPELKGAVEKVIESAAFSSGIFVAEFEERFARLIGCKHSVGLNSGTSALHTALLATGVGPGDEVITSPFTFIATVEAISYAGAYPCFVDIEEDYYTIDPAGLKEFILRKTVYDRNKKNLLNRLTRRPIRAIIPVHLYGQSADLDPIIATAREYNLRVIEDCAQSHLATYNGKKTGTFGDVGCFSFYPSKNLGACGEAGAIVTDDPLLALKVRMMRDHGQRKKYLHEMIGFNYRMEGLQGAMLGVKLNYLKAWNERRQKIARLYNELLSDVDGVVIPRVRVKSEHIYHLYVVKVKKREEAIKYLEQRGVGTAIHYPFPIHLTPAYNHLGYKAGDFPVSEASAREVLSLPMFPELKEEEVKYVAGCLKAFLKSSKK